jgi:hypothetical protein
MRRPADASEQTSAMAAPGAAQALIAAPGLGVCAAAVSSTRSRSAPSRNGTTRLGFCEVGLVAHCATSTQGFYLCTLCAVDIATTWGELEVVWGKGQTRVGSAVHYVRKRLPVPLVGLDSDNGSEFINHRLYTWGQREGSPSPAAGLHEERRGPRRAEERRSGPTARRL